MCVTPKSIQLLSLSVIFIQHITFKQNHNKLNIQINIYFIFIIKIHIQPTKETRKENN